MNRKSPEDQRNWFFRPPHYYSVRGWLKHYFGGLYDRAGEHHIFLYAGGLSFSLFVCVVPMVLIIFAVLGTYLAKATIQTEISSFIERLIPYEAYASSVREFVFERISEFRTYRQVAGIIGAIGLLFAASGLFSSLRTILNIIFATKIGKNVVIGKLRDLGMVLLVLGYFLVSTTILPGLEIIKESASRVEFLHFLEFGFLESLFFFVASFLIIFVAFYILYSMIPYEKLEKRVLVVSAFWAAILWELAKQGFGYYITHFATIKAIYGTYVFLIIVGFWFYYSSIVFILGAEIGQLYRERRQMLG